MRDLIRGWLRGWRLRRSGGDGGRRGGRLRRGRLHGMRLRFFRQRLRGGNRIRATGKAAVLGIDRGLQRGVLVVRDVGERALALLGAFVRELRVQKGGPRQRQQHTPDLHPLGHA